MAERYFTLEEARSILPRIRELLERSQVVLDRMHELVPNIKDLAEGGERNTGSSDGTDYVYLLMALHGSVSQLQESGCLVKSLEDGLIDFPHLREGREVYLCWKYGEDDIEYWHEMDAGYAGRTRIEEEGMAEDGSEQES